MRWYISAASVRQYQTILGLAPVDDGPQFDRAAVTLERLCEQAKLARDEGHRAIYRVMTRINGRKTRLELTVSLSERDEGDLPQLVRVRDKGQTR